MVTSLFGTLNLDEAVPELDPLWGLPPIVPLKDRITYWLGE